MLTATTAAGTTTTPQLTASGAKVTLQNAATIDLFMEYTPYQLHMLGGPDFSCYLAFMLKIRDHRARQIPE